MEKNKTLLDKAIYDDYYNKYDPNNLLFLKKDIKEAIIQFKEIINELDKKITSQKIYINNKDKINIISKRYTSEILRDVKVILNCYLNDIFGDFEK